MTHQAGEPGGHTPTPWANCEGAIFRVIDARGFTVATVASDSDLRDQWEANAAFIVKAVNSYEAMRKALVEECAKIADAEADSWIKGEATTAVGQAFQRASRQIALKIRALALTEGQVK